MIQKQTCWKSHLANTHPHTRRMCVCQQEKQNCHSNSRKKKEQQQALLPTTMTMTTGHIVVTCHSSWLAGRETEVQRERECEIRVMGKKWWMTKLYSKCGPGLVPCSLLPLRDMWPLMTINFASTFCYFVIVISALRFPFLLYFEPLESQITVLNFPAY